MRGLKTLAAELGVPHQALNRITASLKRRADCVVQRTKAHDGLIVEYDLQSQPEGPS